MRNQVLTIMPFTRLSIPPLSRITPVIVLEYLFQICNLALLTSIHQVLNSIKYLKSAYKSNSPQKLFLLNMLESNKILQHLLFSNFAYIRQSSLYTSSRCLQLLQFQFNIRFYLKKPIYKIFFQKYDFRRKKYQFRVQSIAQK
jgi:hypothetical protein